MTLRTTRINDIKTNLNRPPDFDDAFYVYSTYISTDPTGTILYNDCINVSSMTDTGTGDKDINFAVNYNSNRYSLGEKPLWNILINGNTAWFVNLMTNVYSDALRIVSSYGGPAINLVYADYQVVFGIPQKGSKMA